MSPLNLAGLPVSAIIAAITKKRTPAEQAIHDFTGKSNKADLWMPGMASYNMFKRRGAIGTPETNKKYEKTKKVFADTSRDYNYTMALRSSGSLESISRYPRLGVNFMRI